MPDPSNTPQDREPVDLAELRRIAEARAAASDGWELGDGWAYELGPYPDQGPLRSAFAGLQFKDQAARAADRERAQLNLAYARASTAVIAPKVRTMALFAADLRFGMGVRRYGVAGTRRAHPGQRPTAGVSGSGWPAHANATANLRARVHPGEGNRTGVREKGHAVACQEPGCGNHCGNQSLATGCDTPARLGIPPAYAGVYAYRPAPRPGLEPGTL